MSISTLEIYCAAQPPAGAPDHYPTDWRPHLVDGLKAWSIKYAGGQRGWMAYWPSGRGALMMGADSQCGDWHGDPTVDARALLLLDDHDDDYRPVYLTCEGERTASE